METLLAPLGEINAFREAVECIGNNKLPIHISGCMDTQKCHFIYGLSQGIQWKVIITQNEIQARKIAEDYRIFDRNVLYYPSKDVIFYSAMLDELVVSSSVISEDKKTINYSTNELTIPNESSVLVFSVLNNSSFYDAEVSIECNIPLSN